MLLNPSWLGCIASGPETLTSSSPKMWKEWTHDSLCPERSLSCTVWTLEDKYRTITCTSLHRRFWSLLFPQLLFSQGKHSSYQSNPWEGFFCSLTLLVLCVSVSSFLTFSSPLVLFVRFKAIRLPQPQMCDIAGWDQWSLLLTTLFVKGARTGCSEDCKNSAKMLIEVMPLPFHVALGLLWCSFCQ